MASPFYPPDDRLNKPSLFYPHRKPIGNLKPNISGKYTVADYDFLFTEYSSDTIYPLGKKENGLTAITPLWDMDYHGVQGMFAGGNDNRFEITSPLLSTSTGDGLGDFTCLVYGYFVRESIQRYPLCQRLNAAPTSQFALSLNQGNVAGTVNFFTYSTSTTDLSVVNGLPSSGWYVFVIKRKANNLFIYRDGIEIGNVSGVIRAVWGSATDFAFGARPTSPLYPMNGSILLSRLFNSAVNDAEIYEISKNPYGFLSVNRG